MRKKEEREESSKAGSNGRKMSRSEFLSKVYLNCNEKIEGSFLSKIMADSAVSNSAKNLMVMSYRTAAMDVLSAIERVYGIEGLKKISKNLKMDEDSASDSEEGGEEDDEGDCCGEGGPSGGPAPIDDEPQTYEKVDPKRVDPFEKLSKPSRFPVELVDKEDLGEELDDEERERVRRAMARHRRMVRGRSKDIDEDGEEDDDEDRILPTLVKPEDDLDDGCGEEAPDMVDLVALWEEVRDLWKDFDPAYR